MRPNVLSVFFLCRKRQDRQVIWIALYLDCTGSELHWILIALDLNCTGSELHWIWIALDLSAKIIFRFGSMDNAISKALYSWQGYPTGPSHVYHIIMGEQLFLRMSHVPVQLLYARGYIYFAETGLIFCFYLFEVVLYWIEVFPE